MDTKTPSQLPPSCKRLTSHRIDYDRDFNEYRRNTIHRYLPRTGYPVRRWSPPPWAESSRIGTTDPDWEGIQMTIQKTRSIDHTFTLLSCSDRIQNIFLLRLYSNRIRGQNTRLERPLRRGTIWTAPHASSQTTPLHGWKISVPRQPLEIVFLFSVLLPWRRRPCEALIASQAPLTKSNPRLRSSVDISKHLEALNPVNPTQHPGPKPETPNRTPKTLQQQP